MAVRLRRAFEDASPDDGYRVLVDRLWPRGRTREQLALDEWVRDIAPSTGLRKWFGHDVARWDEFQRRYEAELAGQRETLRQLARRAKSGTVTLVFAAQDTEHSNAAVIRRVLAGIA